jgi:hypothetical protein
MTKIYSFSTDARASNFAAFPQCLDLKKIEDLTRGNYNNISFPVFFKQGMGKKKLTDILDTGHPSFYLISDRLKKILEDNDIKGWKTYPIFLLENDNQEIQGYHGLSIIGTCDPEDYSQSEIIEKQFIANGPFYKYYKGFKVTPHEDFDFFIPPFTVGFCISEKLAQLLKKHKITNLSLEDIEEYEIDCDIIDSK